MSKTLFEKIWDKHVVDTLPDGTIQLYIDRLYCHEVTSPQAFAGLRARGLKPFRPAQITCMPDHNIVRMTQKQFKMQKVVLIFILRISAQKYM